MNPDLPLVEELVPPPDPVVAWQWLRRLPRCLFLDSSLRQPQLGRYSFLMADPFEFREIAVGSLNPFSSLRAWIDNYKTTHVAELPPFQGGLAGLFSYDLNRSLEVIPQPDYDEFNLPAVAVGLYDVVIAWDHRENRCWIISQGFPENGDQERQDRARERLARFTYYLRESSPRIVSSDIALQPRKKLEELSPQFAMNRLTGLWSNMSTHDYHAKARKCIDYIHAGDVFQVNFAQRLLYLAQDSSPNLYLRLRERNPATFSAYFDFGSFQLLSASPERFVKIENDIVETRPIKGTRRRTFVPEADLFRGDELRESEKDRAENVMIVDLLRNDLSRVCTPDSVRVTQLCDVETYEYVQHLVSAVEGRLRSQCCALDVLEACFPGGSITGAPKVRAMEIIAELEPNARGAYCGSLGYIGFDGTADFNILIRTITSRAGWWQFPVGGGIVAQSDIAREYEETWHKAAGLLKSLDP